MICTSNSYRLFEWLITRLIQDLKAVHRTRIVIVEYNYLDLEPTAHLGSNSHKHVGFEE